MESFETGGPEPRLQAGRVDSRGDLRGCRGAPDRVHALAEQQDNAHRRWPAQRARRFHAVFLGRTARNEFELCERHALAAVDPRATVWIPGPGIAPSAPRPSRDRAGRGRSLHVVHSETATDVLSGDAVEDPETLFELGARELLGHTFIYTACAPPTGTDESKIAIATSGWAARFRECFASGDDTQWKLR